MFQTTRLDASINLALEAAAEDDEILLGDADAYGRAMAQTIAQKFRRYRLGLAEIVASWR